MSEGLKEYTRLNRYYRMKEMFDFLEVLKETGITNMFGASDFIWMGKQRIEHEFKYKDIPNEEKFEELISLADQVRDNLIYGSYKQVSEKTDIENERYFKNIENKMRIDAQDILKTWFKLKGSRTIRESEEKKPALSDIPSFFLRRFDGKKFDDNIRRSTRYAFNSAENVDEFVEIALETAIKSYLWSGFEIDTDEWDFGDFSKITEPLKVTYKPLLKSMYYRIRKSYAGN
jgi:hypothetical protein